MAAGVHVDYLRPEDGEWLISVRTGEMVCQACRRGDERQVRPPQPWRLVSAEGKQQVRIAEQGHPDGWETHWPIPLCCHRCGDSTPPRDWGDYFERTDYTKVPITEEALNAATTSY